MPSSLRSQSAQQPINPPTRHASSNKVFSLFSEFIYHSGSSCSPLFIRFSAEDEKEYYNEELQSMAGPHFTSFSHSVESYSAFISTLFCTYLYYYYYYFAVASLLSYVSMVTWFWNRDSVVCRLKIYVNNNMASILYWIRWYISFYVVFCTV